MHQKSVIQKAVVVLVVLCGVMGAGFSPAAAAYPENPVQLVIPFGPGGLTDILWRSISDHISKEMKATLVLVNKPGGGGVVGTAFAAAAKADGYTLVSANSDPLTISPVFTPSVTYHPDKNFTYIAKLVAFAQTLSVREDSPFKTIEDVVAYAKANPRKLKAAVMGVGSTPHTILGVFKQEAGIEINAVPFDSGGETVVNLVGGHTDICIVSVSALKAQLDAGKVRILGMCSPRRIPGYPDIPTLAEKGFKKSSIATGVGLAGPKGLDPTIVAKWQTAIEATMKDPAMASVIEKLGGCFIDYKTGEAYKKELMADYDLFKELLPTLSGQK